MQIIMLYIVQYLSTNFIYWNSAKRQSHDEMQETLYTTTKQQKVVIQIDYILIVDRFIFF